MADTKKFRILSLDGGGVRGYLSIRILENIENYLDKKEGNKKPIGERFDLIAGTSTGSIIASLLAKGLSAKEVSTIYESSMKKVFQKRSLVKRLFQSKYCSLELENIAKEQLTDEKSGNLLIFNELKTDLLITAFNLENFKPKVFKSKYSKKNTIDYYVLDAIMASTAAPSYFPAYDKVCNDTGIYIDGGVSANNPALIALIDSKHFDRKSKKGTTPIESLDSVSLLSVGTGKYATRLNLKGLKNSPSWDWALSFAKKTSPIKDVMFASQEEIEESKVRLLSESEKVFYTRINPNLREKIALDDVEKMNLLDKYASISGYREDLEKMLLEEKKNDI